MNELLSKYLRIMDSLCNPWVPGPWEKSNVIVDHEAATSLFSPSCLPNVSKNRPRVELTGQWAEDAPNDTAIRGPNQMSALSPRRFPRKKSRLRTAKVCQCMETDAEAPSRTSVPVLVPSKVPSKDSREHSVPEWESHKGNIKQLYRVQGLKLEEVMEIMERNYGFAATYVLLRSF
jgi:hypothetical protein